ncbi:uncharacterized protein MONBRDRAFT_30080 [Monosiga brevicollis MX1]|uniref:Protein kinase domain-containing protein n=1 Tax=Monosiga brevicollis TaxID=81824 RepID=A9VCZ0_MONBE|nr:uncharacterized protein MONBRDRAFT_30080 [Monosiga brevicollis MX1]EDQ84586.1 predicted protein [Monosiga brevicollis MX1]|eukprot:XP_001750613.1 hypothetical protein [Monosiga brevicollis MX1]
MSALDRGESGAEQLGTPVPPLPQNSEEGRSLRSSAEPDVFTFDSLRGATVLNRLQNGSPHRSNGQGSNPETPTNIDSYPSSSQDDAASSRTARSHNDSVLSPHSSTQYPASSAPRAISSQNPTPVSSSTSSRDDLNASTDSNSALLNVALPDRKAVKKKKKKVVIKQKPISFDGETSASPLYLTAQPYLTHCLVPKPPTPFFFCLMRTSYPLIPLPPLCCWIAMAERYRMGPQLGKGAFSVVNECFEYETHKRRAVKIVFKATDQFDRKQVLREIDIAVRVGACPNVVQYFTYIEEPDRFCIVYEHMAGGNLMECIRGLSAFTERLASMVIRDVASGISYLHRNGIVHRDIKPQNILCQHEGKVTPAKICDFNLAAVIDSSNGSKPLMTPVGTPEYMSPEVADAIFGGAASYDFLCDCWSLGVVTYLILSGQAPFRGPANSNTAAQLRGQMAALHTEELLDAISGGEFSFPASHWHHISSGAKDFITRLLVRAEDRLTARQVLMHPWIRHDPPAIALKTPEILRDRQRRNTLDQFADAANATHRRMNVSSESLKLCHPTKSTISQRRRSSRHVVARAFNEIRENDLDELVTPSFRD